MRPHNRGYLSGCDSPLIVGTMTEGWEQALIGYVVESTTTALDVQPRLAAGYFLRGWAAYLGDPGALQAQADLVWATELDPGENAEEPLQMRGEQYA